MAACLAQSAGVGVDQMNLPATALDSAATSLRQGACPREFIRGRQIRTNTPDIQLAIYCWNSSSQTRVSRQNQGASKATHTRVCRVSSTFGKGVPNPPARRTHTRVCAGPPRVNHRFSNEGPAQPALRRFGVRSKTSTSPSFKPPAGSGTKVDPTGRFAAPRRLGIQQTGGCMPGP
jgi:hypothetical protein